MPAPHHGPRLWAPLQPPAGLGDLAELDGPWARAAHHAAVAVLAGAVGNADTWTPWGYAPPGAYRGYAPPVVPGRHPWAHAAPTTPGRTAGPGTIPATTRATTRATTSALPGAAFVPTGAS